ncbi:AMP-binding protein [Pseudoalteromonas luteoviolacea]|uniref:non-ribosomal peptide synthetase n=1 Tax=Pseudoalteromonas luteoviolacea TaxID=43657 RepID=UPI001B39E27C|nr:non-ribosomal peptide synthetase [Pseudoalteromonas luteoviolacea]MBQ4878450.1 AMP-binding protein [Pseudoalteromonas luteoviolacea]MBQ4907605.1 AMP-binding protein [Pseudoalteromonas luteoviolacea]
MITEYIEEYQQGVVLTANQQRFVTEGENTSALVQLLVPCSTSLQEIQRYADELVQSHLSLASNYQQVEGFKGLRAVPSTDAKIQVDNIEWAQVGVPSLAQLAVISPVEIAPHTGCNLHLTRINTPEQSYLALRGFAGALDLSSLELIAAIIAGQPDDEEALQFPDFVAWQQEMLHDEDGLAGQVYWQNYLTGDIPAPLQLPYNMGTVSEGERSYTQVQNEIDTALWQGVEQFAQTMETSPQNIVQYAWWWLMARLATTPRFLTALHYDPRLEDEAFEGALGRYAKSLPLIVEYQPEQSLHSWLGALNEQCENHRQVAQSISLAQLNTALNTTDAVLLPLHSAQPDWQVSQHHALNLAVSQQGTLTLNYCQNSFSAAAVSSLLAQLAQVLHVIHSAEVHTQSSEISILSDGHKSQLLAINGVQLATPAETVIARVAGFASTDADSVALIDADSTLTYGQLWQQVERTAKGLKARQPDSIQPILLLLPRSTDLIVAMLASMRAGFGFVPLDPSWPQARIDKVVAQFDNATLIAESTQTGVTVQALQADSDVVLPTLASLETRLAYSIFTSGSTGTPKGVRIGQQQLSAYCAASSEALGLSEQNNFALTATVAADLGYTCLFNALYLGKRLCIASEKQSMDSSEFGAFLSEYQIDCIKIVPSHLQALCDLKALPYFPQKIVLGGEACPNTFLRSLQQWAPHSEIYNHYGPSEATIGVMCHRYVAGDGGVAKLSQVFAGTHTYVLNQAGQLCSYGEVGELFIAGAQLSDGYLGQPEHPAFTEHSELAQRLYATGDLARYMPDNSVMILGRKDDQVKVRGFRIELGEVAACIEQLEGIEHALVVADKVDGQVRLNAYLIANQYEGGALDSDATQALKSALSHSLPEAMIPSAFMVVAQWPRLGNGKIDRKALPSFASQTLAYEAPQGELEEKLAAVFAEVLELDKVSRSASFFQLGGHSIAAIKLVKRWADREASDLHFDLGVLFQAPSVAKLADVLSTEATEQITPLNSHKAGNRQVICFHDGLGLSLSYRALAEHLNDQVNLFSLEPNSADLAVDDFDALAQSYADKLIAQFAGQHIELLGWSMGGLLAAKVATLLEAAGQRVTQLYLADSWIPTAQTRNVSQLDAVSEFLTLVVDNGGEAWAQRIDGYFAPLLVDNELDSGTLSAHLQAFWQSAADALPLPYNAITAQQLADTFTKSERLKALRAVKCTLPSLPETLSTHVLWSKERLASDIDVYSAKLTSNGASMVIEQLDVGHQEVVRHPQLLNAVATQMC